MKDTDWEILCELYKTPSLTKVANMLYITQPSLTKRLQNIEAEFQVAIVNRTPKGLQFTREGEFLAKQAVKYLELMKETKEGLAEFRDQSETIIRIGSSYTFSKYELNKLLVPYTMRHPEIHFEIMNDQSNILFRKMLDDSIDVAFVRGDYSGNVNQQQIGESQAYLVTKKPVKLEKLPEMQRISYKTNDRTIEILEGWWHENFETKVPPGMMIGYIDVCWQLVYEDMGYMICFLPGNFRNEYDLCLTPLTHKDGSPVIRRTWFVYTKNKRISKPLENFIHYIEQESVSKE